MRKMEISGLLINEEAFIWQGLLTCWGISKRPYEYEPYRKAEFSLHGSTEGTGKRLHMCLC